MVNQPLISRHELILKHLAEKQYLTLNHIHPLVFPDRSRTTTWNAVNDLQRKKLVIRQSYVFGYGMGQQDSLFALTAKGIGIVNQSPLSTEEGHSDKQKHKKLSSRSYQHRKACLDFWVSVEVSLREPSFWQLETIQGEWTHSRDESITIQCRENGDAKTLRPDLFMTLLNTSSQQRWLFWVEIDRSTEAIHSSASHSMATKLEKYQSILEHSSLEAFQQPIRVLLVSQSAKRAQHLWQYAFKHLSPASQFLFSVLSEVQHKGLTHSQWLRSDRKGVFQFDGTQFYDPVYTL